MTFIGLARGTTTPVRTDPTGRHGPTQRQARGPGWRRTSRGLYVPADVEPTPLQRVAEAGALLPAGVAVTGWAALCWRRARWHTGTRADGSAVPIDVAAATQCLRDQAGVRVHRERFDPEDVVELDGLLVMSAVAAVVFVMRHAVDLDSAVEALDMTYRADLVTPEQVSAWLVARPGLVGIRQAREALRLADENSWSPQETRARLAWERHTGRRPLANRPVFDLDGDLLGTPDLLDLIGPCGEYDGDHHLDRGQRRVDLEREQRLLDHGLTPFTIVAGDLGSGRLQRRLDSAFARAARVPPEDRRWTLEPPPWWRPTLTVVQRGGPREEARPGR